MAGARDRRQVGRIEKRLNQMPQAAVVPADFDHCRAFVKRYTLPFGVGWPDCLIAATALRLRLPVVTLNDKHFRVIRGLRVMRPY